MLRSLSRAGDAAIQTTLNAICDKLKNNVPLMYHISALLHNDEWTGVLEASIAGGGSSSGDKPETKNKSWKLRTVVKKQVLPVGKASRAGNVHHVVLTFHL